LKNKKVLMTGLAALFASLTVIAAAVARPDSHRSASAVTASSLCKSAGLAYAGPLSGGAAFLGDDQHHWMQLFISYWNSGKKIPGVPATMKRVKLVDALDGDSGLDPQKAATVGAQIVSNSKILGLVGFAGTNENLGGMPVLIRGGIAAVSGSATGDQLTDGKTLKPGYFFRVVPNNTAQASLGVSFMLKKLGLKSGNKVMVVDDAEAYGIGISDAAQAKLKAAGVTVDRESQDQKNTDYSALAQKAVAEGVKVVYAPNQIASDSQLFAQQLKAAGYKGIFFATDGSFDNTSFTFPGAYVSFFATDIYQLKAVHSIVHDFAGKYGKTTPFGAPSWVGAQALAMAISQSCTDGKTSRAEVRADLAKVKMTTSLLGHPISFTKNGDVATGGVTVFQIQGNKTYKLVSAG
jgi:ABC-type branched-subunit amino acid transport system substrate-binding protein